MDNVCHTLVGAALGQAGLNRRTRLASATLMIASNLPDIDVLVFATSTPSVAFRRGWTHGVLAQALLPLILAGVMALVARRRRERVDEPSFHLPSILLLSYVGVLLHVFMDYLNNYGVRLLMPFERRWFYGDTLFIVDPWLWLMLGAGAWFARRRHLRQVALGAVLASALYMMLMLASARAARAVVASAWQSVEGQEAQALMVGPLPMTPLQRAVIIDAGDRYVTGTFNWLPTGVQFDTTTIPKPQDDPRVGLARTNANIAAFLVWSRFPYWTLEPVAGGTRVSVRDMRFGGAIGGRFAVSTVVPN